MVHELTEEAEPPWIDQPHGGLARGLLRTLQEAGLPGNCNAQVGFWSDQETVVPFTVSRQLPGQSWLVSAENHFYDYAEQELRWLGAGWRQLCAVAFKALRALTVWRSLEPVVYVNNWLVSTCLYEGFSTQQLGALLSELRSRYPGSAICFRTLAVRTNGQLLEHLSELGGERIMSRRVLFQPVAERRLMSLRQVKNDRRVMVRSGYSEETAQDWGKADWRRVGELYRLLYLEKYSLSNPHYHADFFEAAERHGLLTFFGLRSPQGQLDGVLGLYRRDGIQAHPIFGYDTGLPQNLGLYRSLTWLSLREAQGSNCLAHASAGVADFKRGRGGESEWEWMMAFTSHLSPRKRLSWQLVKLLSNRLAKPLMEKFDL